MCFCCASCEVLYVLLFLVAEIEIESLPVVSGNAVKQSWLKGGILGLAGLGWGIKQLVNVIQMKTAADVCVLYDINKEKHPPLVRRLQSCSSSMLLVRVL